MKGRGQTPKPEDIGYCPPADVRQSGRQNTAPKGERIQGGRVTKARSALSLYCGHVIRIIVRSRMKYK